MGIFNDLLRLLGRPDTVNPAPGSVEGLYQLPGRPPAGRHVQALGSTWLCLRDGRFAYAEGAGVDETVRHRDWYELFAHGSVRLLPLTDEERASEALYGPIGARWGDPDTPCPYIGCAQGVGHTGDHVNEHGEHLGVTPEATEPHPTGGAVGLSQAKAVRCTCGNPANHQRGCPRYARVAGVPEPEPEATAIPTYPGSAVTHVLVDADDNPIPPAADYEVRTMPVKRGPGRPRKVPGAVPAKSAKKATAKRAPRKPKE